MAMDRVVLTYADYAALPDDGKRYEIHEGELSVTPAPGTRHQMVCANLGDVLRAHVKQRASGLAKMQLYARHAVPFYWIVDPAARVIEARALEDGAYRLALRVAGAGSVSLPPFADLALVPDALWPTAP